MNAKIVDETTLAADRSLAPLTGAMVEGSAEGQTPLESGAPPGMEGLSVDPGAARPRVSSTWLLLVGAVALSTGMLWGMRWIGMKGGITGKDVKFDQSLVEAASRPKRNHSVVLEDLKTSRVTRQVPGEQVKKNPFRLADAMAGMYPAREAGPDTSGDEAARLAAMQLDATKRRDFERHQAIHSELKGFNLQTVLGGKPPLARVNGKLVREGDKIGNFFTVKAIHGRIIEVECDGKVYEVGMAPTDVANGEPEEP